MNLDLELQDILQDIEETKGLSKTLRYDTTKPEKIRIIPSDNALIVFDISKKIMQCRACNEVLHMEFDKHSSHVLQDTEKIRMEFKEKHKHKYYEF